jgi:AcrR family transcriptional regulator
VSRKAIPDLEERLLAETISRGGLSSANVDFSTKDIAEACEVSEATLFQHFKNKETLISRAALSICEEHYETFLAWVKEGDTLDVFSSRVLDHFLSHPESTLFLINYSAASSHLVKDDGAFQRHYAFAVAHFDLLEPYFGKRKESEEFLLWSSYFRRLLMDAQFVLSGLYNDVASYREMSQKIAVSGIKAFRKEGN